MDYAVIRYTVKDTGLEENRALIGKVFEELGQSAPEALQYLVLELDKGEFMHVVATPEGSADSPLPRLAAFRAFSENHAERRTTPVMRSPARIVGNYRMLGARKPD
jgi:hypothetical protein